MRGKRTTPRAASLWLVGLTVLSQVAGMAAAVADDPEPDWFTEADPIAVTSSEGRVRDFQRIGDVLFVGGSHTTLRDFVGGPDLGPAYLGAVDRVGGRVVTAFQPVLDGEVRALAASLDGSKLYVGGRFDTVNGEAWPNFVVLDPVTGQRIDDVRVTGGGVDDIQVASDGTVYLGGAFARINGVTRRRIGAIDGVTGATTSFSPPDPLDTVRSIALSPDEQRVYYGGGYTDRLINEFRGFLYAADRDDGEMIGSFLPDVEEAEVFDVAAHEDRVYAALGGLGGRGKAFRTDGSTRARWRADGDVQVVTVVGNRVIFGGHFIDHFGSHETQVLAAFETSDLDYDADLWFDVRGSQGAWAILHDEQFLWIGGDINDARPRSVRGFARYTARSADVSPPTRPGKPTVSVTGVSELTVQWAASEDDTFFVEYDVYRNGSMWRTVDAPIVVDRSVLPDHRYEYVVVAVDRTGKESPPSLPGSGWGAPPLTTQLIGGDDGWRYRDDGVAPPAGWTDTDLDHRDWAWGRQILGFGEGDETTVIEAGPPGNRHVTAYFRRHFGIRRHTEVFALELDIEVDDGAIVYLNSVEVGRINMPSGPVSNETTASSTVDRLRTVLDIDPALLVIGGRNVLSVEVHQASTGSSDLRLTAELTASMLNAEWLIPRKSSWRFDDDGFGDRGWKAAGFDDTTWESGQAPFGTGRRVRTRLADVTTVYFRHTFEGGDYARYDGVWLKVRDNDGYIVRLNGVRVAKVGVPPPPVRAGHPATRRAPDHRWVTYLLPADRIVDGDNLITVEIHNHPEGRGVFFDASLEVRP